MRSEANSGAPNNARVHSKASREKKSYALPPMLISLRLNLGRRDITFLSKIALSSLEFLYDSPKRSTICMSGTNKWSIYNTERKSNARHLSLTTHQEHLTQVHASLPISLLPS